MTKSVPACSGKPAAPIVPVSLRVEYEEAPLGLDVEHPRFSWNLAGAGRQAGYRISAADTAERLLRGNPNLWDSGRVDGPRRTFVEYAGRPLTSGLRVFWKVGVWAENGLSAESPVHAFEMGLLHPSDWQGTFLAPPFCGGGGRGYHSAVYPAGQHPVFWVQVDLETEREFDRLAVYPCYYREYGEQRGAGFGFPVRFKIETAADAGMRERRPVYETTNDVPPPGLQPYGIPLPRPVRGRFVRLTVLRPWTLGGPHPQALLALDEFQVFSGNLNIARGKPVSCANTLVSKVAAAAYDWHADCLTDGIIHVDEPRHDQGRGNLCRRTFRLDKPVARARAYLACRGWCELRINGRKAGDAVLDPAWTVFDKRLLYSTWDVTGLLQPGDNAATVLIGNGWALSPACILQLNIEHADGSRSAVVSDGQWKQLRSAVCENNVYHGETHDARLADAAVFTPAFDDGPCPFVPTVTDYAPALSAQINPPIRVTDTIAPVAWNEPQPGVWVCDLGRNIAGFARLRVRAEPGREIRMRFAETIYDDGSVWTDAAQTAARRDGRLAATDGTINTANCRTARVTDRFLCAGGDEIWEPQFTYHGFRFVELTGFPGRPAEDTLTGCAAHTDVRSTGHFHCSNELLNWAQNALRQTLLNNLHSVPTDCCQRDERQGWMGDAQAVCETVLYNFDAASTYVKWLRDMRDEQRADGAIGDTTPFTLGRMGGDVAWGGAIVLVAWDVYLHTGDRNVLETHYAAMRRYVDFLDRSYPARIVDDSDYGGDWLGIEETPHPITHTGFFLHCVRTMARCAAVLGRVRDRRRFETLGNEIAARFQEALFHRETGQYGNGSQFSNLWPLYLGVVPAELRKSVLARLTGNIERRNGHLGTGFLGTRYLLELLCDFGRDDLAYAIATAEGFPGWGHMRAHRATTMWEHWELKTGNGMNSHDHPCFCSIGGWFMKCLAGIRPDPERAGFANMRIAPVFPDGLDRVEAALLTVRGRVRSGWERRGREVEWTIETPSGSSAELRLPRQVRAVDGPDEAIRRIVSRPEFDPKAPILLPDGGGEHTLHLVLNGGARVRRTSVRPGSAADGNT